MYVCVYIYKYVCVLLCIYIVIYRYIYRCIHLYLYLYMRTRQTALRAAPRQQKNPPSRSGRSSNPSLEKDPTPANQLSSVDGFITQVTHKGAAVPRRARI